MVPPHLIDASGATQDARPYSFLPLHGCKNPPVEYTRMTDVTTHSIVPQDTFRGLTPWTKRLQTDGENETRVRFPPPPSTAWASRFRVGRLKRFQSIGSSSVRRARVPALHRALQGAQVVVPIVSWPWSTGRTARVPAT